MVRIMRARPITNGMSKKEENLDKLIESVLFIYGNPMKLKKLSNLLSRKEIDLKPALLRLGQRLEESSGLRLIKNGPEIQLVSAKEHAKFVDKLFKGEHKEELTRAALEVLAVIAYQGPVTRAEIELIRGVNCSYMIRNLLIRGLVQKKSVSGKKTTPLYEISLAAMRKFGLTSQEDLPGFRQIKTEIEKVRSAMQTR